MMRTIGLLLACLLGALLPATSAAQEARWRDLRSGRGVVEFRTTHVPTGANGRAFVLGDVPELGEDDIRRAIPMVAGPGDSWRVSVELPTDRRIVYRFVERDDRRLEIPRKLNGFAISGDLELGPSFDGLGGGKTLFFHSAFEDPVLFWRQGGGAWEAQPLVHLGPAHGVRLDGRERWGAWRVGRAGEPIDFHLRSAAGTRRDPPSGFYRTPLDRALLQDGELFTYLPAPSVSPARRAYPKRKPPRYDSTFLGEKRTYRVFLPRGYDEHVGRRYPVLYFYDGQLVWEQPGHWDHDLQRTARFVAAGEVREAIFVAIDSPLLTEGRCADTTPPDDITPLTGLAGMADLFMRFVLDELKPRIDATYRTLPDRENTFFQGFSSGGVLALYAGWDFHDAFEAVASQSPAPDQAPRFLARVRRQGKRPVRIYFDVGILEGNGFVDRLRNLVTHLSGDSPPWVWSGDLFLWLGFGQTHTYLEAGQRGNRLLPWLLGATSERDPGLWSQRRGPRARTVR
jgi:enterochelin esterase-like enzyme